MVCTVQNIGTTKVSVFYAYVTPAFSGNLSHRAFHHRLYAFRCLSRTALTRNSVGWERVDRIPGKHTDRKTLLGELNWIFTSITDTIAWNMLPRSVFQKLFRQDLLLASLFRNFMLAERILKACGCQPVSSPRLPPMHQHPLWDAWDVTAEQALLQLPAVISDEMRFVQSSFFKEQLTAFEFWLNHSGASPESPPQQLPIVLQVLLSQVRGSW